MTPSFFNEPETGGSLLATQVILMSTQVGEPLFLQGRELRERGRKGGGRKSMPVAGYFWDSVNWLISKPNNWFSPVTMFGLHPPVIQLGASAQSCGRSGNSALLNHPGLQPWLMPTDTSVLWLSETRPSRFPWSPLSPRSSLFGWREQKFCQEAWPFSFFLSFFFLRKKFRFPQWP